MRLDDLNRLLRLQRPTKRLSIKTANILFDQLKWYYDQKIISFFSSDFESVFA